MTSLHYFAAVASILLLALSADVAYLLRQRARLRAELADLHLANQQLEDALASEQAEHEATLAVLRVAGRLNRRLAVEKYGAEAVEANERAHGEGGKN
jgi:hypothetical protein